MQDFFISFSIYCIILLAPTLQKTVEWTRACPKSRHSSEWLLQWTCSVGTDHSTLTKESNGRCIGERKINKMFEEMMYYLPNNKPDDPIPQNKCDKKTSKTKASNDRHYTGGQLPNTMIQHDLDYVTPPIIFVLGGPGSGKGTQCKRIAKEFGFTHFSVGDLLRSEVESGSKNGQKIKKAMEEGRIVPPKWTIELLKKALESVTDAKGYLIDGFPRNVKHGPMFEEEVRPCDLVLMLDCNEEIMTKRVLQRANSSGRVDDNEHTLKKRFSVFKQETLPVIEYYEALGKVAKVNSERLVDEVYADIKEILEIYLTS